MAGGKVARGATVSVVVEAFHASLSAADATVSWGGCEAIRGGDLLDASAQAAVAAPGMSDAALQRTTMTYWCHHLPPGDTTIEVSLSGLTASATVSVREDLPVTIRSSRRALLPAPITPRRAAELIAANSPIGATRMAHWSLSEWLQTPWVWSAREARDHIAAMEVAGHFRMDWALTPLSIVMTNAPIFADLPLWVYEVVAVVSAGPTIRGDMRIEMLQKPRAGEAADWTPMCLHNATTPLLGPPGHQASAHSFICIADARLGPRALQAIAFDDAGERSLGCVLACPLGERKLPPGGADVRML